MENLNLSERKARLPIGSVRDISRRTGIHRNRVSDIIRGGTKVSARQLELVDEAMTILEKEARTALAVTA